MSLMMQYGAISLTLSNQNAPIVYSLICADNRLFPPFSNLTTGPFTTKNRYNLPTTSPITAELSALLFLNGPKEEEHFAEARSNSAYIVL